MEKEILQGLDILIELQEEEKSAREKARALGVKSVGTDTNIFVTGCIDRIAEILKIELSETYVIGESAYIVKSFEYCGHTIKEVQLV